MGFAADAIADLEGWLNRDPLPGSRTSYNIKVTRDAIQHAVKVRLPYGGRVTNTSWQRLLGEYGEYIRAPYPLMMFEFTSSQDITKEEEALGKKGPDRPHRYC